MGDRGGQCDLMAPAQSIAGRVPGNVGRMLRKSLRSELMKNHHKGIR